MIIIFLCSLAIVFLEIKLFGLFPSFWLIFSYLKFSPIRLSTDTLFFLTFLPFFFISALILRRLLPKSTTLLAQVFLFLLLFVSPWALQIISGNPLSLLNSRLKTTLSPTQYGYYTDIHRQADLVAGSPLIGKIYYNKYLVVTRNILFNTASLLDPDRIFFISSSGKAPLGSRLYPQLSLLELPILIWGLFLLLRKKQYFLFSLPIVVALFTSLIQQSADPLAYQTDPAWLVWFVLTLIVIITIPKICKKNTHLILTCIAILLLRFSLVIISFTDNPNPHRIFSAYQNLSQSLKELAPDQKVYLTDRLGQPHVYLTFFDVFTLSDFKTSLTAGLPHDKFDLPQPPTIRNFEFTSFTFDEKTFSSGTYVELSSNFPSIYPNFTKIISLEPEFEYASTAKTISDHLVITQYDVKTK